MEAAAWGLFGGFAVEGLQLASAIRRTTTWPWTRPEEPSFWPYMLSIFIRLAVGAGLAGAAAASDKITTVIAAVSLGVAAPLVIEQMMRAIPGQTAEMISTSTSAPTPELPPTRPSGSPVYPPDPAPGRNQQPAEVNSPAGDGTSSERVPTYPDPGPVPDRNHRTSTVSTWREVPTVGNAASPEEEEKVPDGDLS